MANEEKFNICTYFYGVSLCSLSAFWRAENAISAQPNIRQILYVVNNFGSICVGIRKIYGAHQFPTLIIANMLIGIVFIFKKHSIKFMSNAVSKLLFRRVSFQNHVQHRYAS
jgi:hypothetical protein